MSMSTAARRALSKTIRGQRDTLIARLDDALEATYRLGLAAAEAGLDEARAARRGRVEDWLREQAAALADLKPAAARAQARADLVKQAAYTLLNRLVFLRLLEANGLRRTPLVTGGWGSQGYADFRALAPELVRGDDAEGYAWLLQLAFEDLAGELPGLFGRRLSDLVPVPTATLRAVIEALDDDALAGCWTDPLTLGWIYQYWNDPEREALDAKLNAGGKVEPHEIASKTQMFTERYMVDWLLQNSLGPMWLAICRKHGWTPDVEAKGPDGKSVLDRLEARREAWRRRRAAGEVAATAMMPLHDDLERRWADYLTQTIPADAVEHAPESVRDLRLLDPAVGSGHFLVVAFDLLVALHHEEARHRGAVGQPEWTDAAIVERIVGHTLHGVDLDPRAVQITAAGLWLRARLAAPDARPPRLNLVASTLRLAGLPDDDPALVELRDAVHRVARVPVALVDTIVGALKGADHLGSLLKVDEAVDAAIRAYEEEGWFPWREGAASQVELRFDRQKARHDLVAELERFLAQTTRSDDLGLRIRGEQLTAGVRFLRMMREGQYDLVVANPPYQGTSKMADATYVADHYRLGKADLYAAFLLRGLELVRPHGVSAMLTMRNWMFIKQYAGLRERLLERYDLRALGDFAIGAFDEVPNDILSVVVSAFARRRPGTAEAVALQPTPPDDRSYDRERTPRKRAATRAQVGRHTFEPAALRVVPEWPLVYWWGEDVLGRYAAHPQLGDVAPVRIGLATGDNARFLRRPSELAWLGATPGRTDAWVPYIKGAGDTEWYEPMSWVLNWAKNGLEDKLRHEAIDGIHSRSVRSESMYFRLGVAFSSTGASLRARLHRYESAFDVKGQSVFYDDRHAVVCLMNSAMGRSILEDLNPTVSFQAGDGARLPFWEVDGSSSVCGLLGTAFTTHESHREPSVEFLRPGPSPWEHAQEWAQTAVDRPEGAPLPPYTPVLTPEPPTDHLSYALGVALGRFGGGEGRGGEGILDPCPVAEGGDDLGHALPNGLLFLDTTLDDADRRDGLGHPAAQPLHDAWAAHGGAIAPKKGLRAWLAHDFFKDVHRTMYENRPIHWPLSSAGRSFVAWVNIHRFTRQTLRHLLVDHLLPTRTRLEGELADLRAARDGADAAAARAAERRFEQTVKARDELAQFIADVEQCADRGPLPPDARCPAREQDAPYDPDLDDGVMINSAALWPLLQPQWKDPKKWWVELATAKGRKDYDWSHLAMRYWPTRVDQKCRKDPSYGVAHGCFWRYHPDRAWAWELRLQDEIAPDFRIEEPPYRPGGHDARPPDAGDAPHRDAWLRDHPAEALAAVEKEALRRIGRGQDKAPIADLHLLETGLWTHHAADCYALELRIIEKQGDDFHLRAPDEPAARAAHEAVHPDDTARRHALLGTAHQTTMFTPPPVGDDGAA